MLNKPLTMTPKRLTVLRKARDGVLRANTTLCTELLVWGSYWPGSKERYGAATPAVWKPLDNAGLLSGLGITDLGLQVLAGEKVSDGA